MWKHKAGEIWQARGERERILPEQSKLAVGPNRIEGTEGNREDLFGELWVRQRGSITCSLACWGVCNILNVFGLHHAFSEYRQNHVMELGLLDWVTLAPGKSKQNSLVDTLTPSVTIFIPRAFKEVIKINEKIRVGPVLIGLVSFLRRGRLTRDVCTH